MHTRAIVVSENIKDLKEAMSYPILNVDEEEIINEMGLLTSGLADYAEIIDLKEDHDGKNMKDLIGYIDGYFVLGKEKIVFDANNQSDTYDVIVLKPNIEKFKSSYEEMLSNMRQALEDRKPNMGCIYQVKRLLSETDLHIYNIPYGMKTAEEFYEEFLCDKDYSDKFYLVSYFDVHY